MMNAHIKFLQGIQDKGTTNLDRAVASLWWRSQSENSISVSPLVLAHDLESAGYARQNSSRLATGLKKDARTTINKDGTFRLKIKARKEFDAEHINYANDISDKASDSLLPICMFEGTRGYIEKIVRQINLSYDNRLYDCCAVMCRRLLETLIIEVYEKNGWANDVKGSDGHFLMFAGLRSALTNDKRFHLGRGAANGLRDFKDITDASAHNRRFNARRSDIDKIYSGVRIAAEELLHLWRGD